MSKPQQQIPVLVKVVATVVTISWATMASVTAMALALATCKWPRPQRNQCLKIDTEAVLSIGGILQLFRFEPVRPCQTSIKPLGGCQVRR